MVLLSISFMTCASEVSGWSNGGYSADPGNPDYGTHDWIAEHALDWLPPQEKQFLLENKAFYLYGTELPDNGQAGIGDTTKHHVYFFANGSVQDAASAVRARDEYAKAVSAYNAGNFSEVALRLGMVTHYIADMAVFGHVMGAGTDWGAESESNHSNYESYVQTRTNSYVDDFNSFLAFDGNLSTLSAYDAALALAYDTTFDVDGDLTCVWMDAHYDWSDATFRNRAGESLNLAVNLIADVLHTFCSTVVIPEFSTWEILPLLVAAMLLVMAVQKGLKSKPYKLKA